MDISGKFNVTFDVYRQTGTVGVWVKVASAQDGYRNTDLFKFGIALPEFSILDGTKYIWLYTLTDTDIQEGDRVYLTDGSKYEVVVQSNVAGRYYKMLLRMWRKA